MMTFLYRWFYIAGTVVIPGVGAPMRDMGKALGYAQISAIFRA
jgi:hypothetical protein